MCAAEMIEHRKNSWELYGFDFMVDDEYNAWLIEINSSPACDYSTPTTERYVQKALVELLSVVLDVREWEAQPKKTRGPCPDTGGWEKIYQGPLLEMPVGAFGTEMSLKGEGYKNLPRPANNAINTSLQQVDFGTKTIAPIAASAASIKQRAQSEQPSRFVQHTASSSDKELDSPKRVPRATGAPTQSKSHVATTKTTNSRSKSTDEGDEVDDMDANQDGGDSPVHQDQDGFDDSDEDGTVEGEQRKVPRKTPQRESGKVKQLMEPAHGQISPPPQQTTSSGGAGSSRHHRVEPQKGNKQVIGAPAVASIPIKVFSVEF